MSDQLADLIGLVYETVFDDGLWPQVLLRLAGLSGADVPAIGFFDPLTRKVSAIAPRTDPADLLKFEKDWAGRTTLFSDLAGVSLGEVVTMHDLVPASIMRATPVFNELLRPMGLGSAALLANIAPPGGPQAILGLYREAPLQDQPFDQEEIEIVATVVRHMARAVELRKQMSVQRLHEDTALLTLEHLRKGVLLLDSAGAVVFANELASRMIDVDGPDSDVPRVIGAWARKSIPAGEGDIIDLPRGRGRAPLKLALLPLNDGTATTALPWMNLFGPSAIVMITDPDLDADRRATALRRRYGLTPAEASFAMEIGKGDGRDAAAQRRGISVSTAHTHLNRIFEKTGVTRQAELVRFLLHDLI